MPWVTNEDRAMKARLSGIRLADLGTPVPVRYSQPEPEAADMTYPILVITRTGIYQATDREHRGRVRIPYTPEGQVPVPAGARWGYYAGFPIPYDIDYQVSVFTRMQAHQTALTAELGREGRIPHRSGTLHIPEIGVDVSMDVQAGPTFSSRLDSDNKRIFETYYLVRVFSEMTPWEIERLTYPDYVAGTLRPLSDDKETEHFDFLYEGEED